MGIRLKYMWGDENRILVVFVKGHDFEPEKFFGKKLESVKVNGIEVVNT